MKKLISLILIITLIGLFSPNSYDATNASCYKKTDKITFSGGTRTVTSIWTKLNDKKIRVEVVAAKKQVGAVDSLEHIAQIADDDDSTVLAAINGSFFNAYSDLQPSGTLQIQGETVHVTNTGTTLGIDGNNNFSITPLYVKIEGSINNSWVWPNNWVAWNINQVFTDPNSTVIFTPAYGAKTSVHTMTSIVVEQKVVTQIIKGQVAIPANGYVIVTGFTSDLKKFAVGYTVDYRVKYYENSYDGTPATNTEIDWDDIRSGVGAGPMLVKDSEIVVDPVREGFKEPKITENRGSRSFIGVTADDMLVMGTVSDVNVFELAEIAKKLGLVEAMNLDGGASSGLYYSGTTLTKPGRLLSNAIVIKQLKFEPIRIFLNGKELFFDAEPYKDPMGRTMVPMRKLFEALGAKVTFEGTTKQITAVMNEKIIQLTIDSNVALVDGQSFTLDSPVVIKNSRAIVPIRFITEQFGGSVDWLKESNSIELTIVKE